MNGQSHDEKPNGQQLETPQSPEQVLADGEDLCDMGSVRQRTRGSFSGNVWDGGFGKVWV